MSYKVNIPPHVLEQINEALEVDGGHLRPNLAYLPEQLEKLAEDPRSGNEIRRDFANGWFIEVGDYRLYYGIYDDKREVRFFNFDRYVYGW